MTLYQKSAWVTAGAIALLFILMAFNYGRLTASQVTLRSGCDLTSDQRSQLNEAYYRLTYLGGRP